jgi:PPK2 family polyphosphate:nucleotide phosphotransferase
MTMTEEEFVVAPGRQLSLTDHDPAYTGPYRDRRQAEDLLKVNLERLDELQNLLYADGRHALLVVLQGIDASGKDGTIRHVAGAFNPQGVRVVSFKVPTERELAHDFLWRVHQHTPGLGEIAVFNRSHYEDVLVVRVHNLVPQDVWRQRYDHINAFERLLVDSGVTILKFFLHISRDEQKRRFEKRLLNPRKNWKFRKDDLKERAAWDDYIAAYEEALSRCSTNCAPWIVVPANHKWYRNLVVSQFLVRALESLNLAYPPGEPGLGSVEIPD